LHELWDEAFTNQENAAHMEPEFNENAPWKLLLAP
jgi:hypothetical protein